MSSSHPTKTESPLVMTELPALPWQNVAMDFCGPFPTGELVLVVIDERSRYPAIEVVTSTSAKSTILALTKVFAIHGIPEKIKSDNGLLSEARNSEDSVTNTEYNTRR